MPFRNSLDSARSPHSWGDQVKPLEIQSSPRGESSDSIALTKSLIEACKSNNSSIVVDTLNVWHESLPEFDYEAIGAKYKAVKHETMTEAESNVWERIQSLIQRFQNADRIVLGTPMWNFGLPYKLKHSIDLVAQRNYLFTYDGKQYGPLLNVEKAIAVYTRGSRFLEGTPIPSVAPHPRGRRRNLQRVVCSSRKKADFERFTNLTPIGSSFIVEVVDAEGNC